MDCFRWIRQKHQISPIISDITWGRNFFFSLLRKSEKRGAEPGFLDLRSPLVFIICRLYYCIITFLFVFVFFFFLKGMLNYIRAWDRDFSCPVQSLYYSVSEKKKNIYIYIYSLYFFVFAGSSVCLYYYLRDFLYLNSLCFSPKKSLHSYV